ncbi:hypothetical protein C2S53_009215 [Perilla frutescens var. hirtella]|uniref:Uncharacterized protein n=1 Tax=Perilla frutescens var. hirtella TaxID=608512 RepID=A0AAD4IPZ4_PERFH|nr:hypothetical protein C2S53_009215 [Perilla frutescens var. hirtella]
MDQDELIKILEEFDSEKTRIWAKAEEETESAKRRMFTKIKSCFKARTNMKLEFRNGIAQAILTGEEIKGEGGIPIEVALVDDSTGDVVDAEPEASAKVEIVLLKGKTDASEEDDWTANIVPQVEGKQPILAGKVALQLQKGIGVVQNITFRHHASKIRPSEFQLGARVVGASHIKEAKTEPFILKDFRAKYYRKTENPSLSDEVSRLVYIRRGGEIDRRLQVKKIFTVEDFLIQLLINPQGLKSIVKSKGKKWEAIVNNARACLSGERVYFYMDRKQKTGAIFNILGHADAETLLACAYENWGEVKPFDDQNSLQQHLECLGTNTGASEMVGESSSRRSEYFSFDSAINLFGETEFGFGSSFSSVTDDVDDVVLYDAGMQLNHAWPCSPSLFEGVDECIQQTYGLSRTQLDGLMEESNADVVNNHNHNRSNAPNRWRKLLCVSKWFSVRKRVSIDVTSNRKKQKLD